MLILIIINFKLVNGSTFFEGEFLHIDQCLEFLGAKLFFQCHFNRFFNKGIIFQFSDLEKII
jgi:hypothetical protein